MPEHNFVDFLGAPFDAEPVVCAKQRFAIFSSQRTGSTYLCTRLINIRDRLGLPWEYLNPQAFSSMGRRLFPERERAVSLDRYLQAVESVRTTGDGWFGAKIQPNQLAPLVNGEFDRALSILNRFDRLIFITRHDKLGQAISATIANTTGVWLNYGEEPDFGGQEATVFFEDIDCFCAQFEKEEKLISELACRLSDRPTLRIAYEEILENSEDVTRRVAMFLGADPAILAEEGLSIRRTRKPPGKLAGQIRSAYLSRRTPGFADARNSALGPGGMVD